MLRGVSIQSYPLKTRYVRFSSGYAQLHNPFKRATFKDQELVHTITKLFVDKKYEDVCTAWTNFCNNTINPIKNVNMWNYALKSFLETGRTDLVSSIHEQFLNSSQLPTPFTLDILKKLHSLKDGVEEEVEESNIVKMEEPMKAEKNVEQAVAKKPFDFITPDFPTEEHYIKQIKRSVHKESTRKYNDLLKHYARDQEYEKFQQLTLQMEKEGIRPDTTTYNTAISLLIMNGETDNALALFNKMKKMKIWPNHFTYSILLRMFATQQDEASALDLFENMKENLLPNAYLYTILIKMYAYNRQMERALDMYREMVDNNIKPTLDSYNVIMKMFAKNGNHDRALEIYGNLRADGLLPNDVTYTILIEIYMHLNDPNRIIEIFNDMKANRIYMSEQILVNLFNQFSNIADSQQIDQLQKIVDAFVPLQFDLDQIIQENDINK